MFLLKLALSNLVIITCVLIGRRFPTMGGLIATMPLTSLIVLIWLYSDNSGDNALTAGYARGMFWGLIPTFAFFATVYLCLRKGMQLPAALGAGGVIWLGGAILHQCFLR